MAGYSGTPLLKKLGIKSNYTIHTKNEPKAYWDWISPLPERIKIVSRPKKETIDFVHLFVTDKEQLEKEFLKLKAGLKRDGMLWVSWPKKSAGIYSDLDGNIVRQQGLSMGLVDVKVCAVNETWSGLKFMYRIKDR